jgi:hypothetical protein
MIIEIPDELWAGFQEKVRELAKQIPRRNRNADCPDWYYAGMHYSALDREVHWRLVMAAFETAEERDYYAALTGVGTAEESDYHAAIAKKRPPYPKEGT